MKEEEGGDRGVNAEQLVGLLVFLLTSAINGADKARSCSL